VADSGIGFSGHTAQSYIWGGRSLAGLLEADLAYDRAAGWTIAEIIFSRYGECSKSMGFAGGSCDLEKRVRAERQTRLAWIPSAVAGSVTGILTKRRCGGKAG